jgi:hypothetical protein
MVSYVGFGIIWCIQYIFLICSNLLYADLSLIQWCAQKFFVHHPH